MGFNIGALIGGLAPAIGSLFGAPGAALGGIIGQTAVAFDRPRQPVSVLSAAPARVPFPGSSSFDFSQAAAGRVPFPLSRLPLPLPAFGGGNGQPTRLRSILDAASSAAGKRITTRDVVSAAKHCGLELAASSFGVSVEDVCFVVVQGTRRRRSRGISAADLRRTRSTIRKIKNMSADLGIGRSPARRRRAH